MALKKSISSHIARYSTIKSSNTSLFAFGIVTLLLFSEAFRSLSTGERQASSYVRVLVCLAFPQESSDASPNNAKYQTIILVMLSFIIKELMCSWCPPDDYKSKNHSFNEKCKVCPMRNGCYKEGAKSKTYSVTIKLDTHAEQEVFQNTEAFKQLAKIATK